MISEYAPTGELWKLPKGWRWVGIKSDLEMEIKNGKKLPLSERNGIYPAFGSGGVFAQCNAPYTKAPVIIIGRTGTFGSLYFSSGLCWPSENTFYIDKFPSNLMPTYIYQYLKIARIKRLGTTTAIRSEIRKKDLYKLSIPIPFFDNLEYSLKMQQQIVDHIESILKDLEKARTLLEQMKGDVDQIIDAALSEIFNESVMDQWPNRKLLGDVTSLNDCRVNPRQSEYKLLPHIGVKSIESRTCRLENLASAEEDKIISENYLFDTGMILYAKIRPQLRKAVYVDFKGICSIDIYPLSVTSDELLPRFLMWSLVAKPFTKYAVALSTRARIPKINQGELFSFSLQYPSPIEQQNIVDYLDTIQEQTTRLGKVPREDVIFLQQLEQLMIEQAFGREV
jgi:restriction endonuclease S subunit